MTEDEALSVLVGVTLSIAEDIYFHKCMFYNVPCLSDSDKKKCIDEAVEIIPEFLGVLREGVQGPRRQRSG